MNFQQLEYVIAVHDCRHFGKAAESCHITQATLSAMIKKLEEELDIVLFDRTKAPVKTTDVGVQFIKLAHQLLNGKNQMHLLKDQVDQNLEGELKIGVIPTIANSLLPLILPELLANNPKLKLTVQEITTENIINQLKKDAIDIGIMATPLEHDFLEETILYYEAMMVYGITDTKKNYISSSDIRNHKIWLLEEGNCFREQSLTICDMKEKELNKNNLTFEGSSFETLLNLTDRFGGFTLIPELYYNNLPTERKIKCKPFNKPIPVREISIVSYRPFTKLQTIKYLNKLVHKKTQAHLSTSVYKARDMEIIGI